MRKGIVFLLLFILLMLSGCQNKRELNEIAIVLGVGVDIGAQDSVDMTVQVANPGNMQSGGGDSGGGGKGGGSPYIVESRSGATLFDAIRNFSMMNSKKLFFSHNQVVIFGEDVAKRGIAYYADFLARDTELRSEVPVLVGRGKASDYLKLPPVMAKIPAEEIDNAINLSEVTGKAVKYTLSELTIALREDEVITLPQIHMTGDDHQKRFQISGMAVLNGSKLAGWLTEEETRGLLWSRGQVEGGVIVVRPENARISLEIKNTKGKVSVDFRGGNPVYKIDIEETGDIDEVMGNQKISIETIKDINKLQKKAIEEEVKKALEKSQNELKADIFGFNEYLHRHYPEYWHQLRDQWKEEYPSIKVEINVKTKINNSAEMLNPPKAGE